MLEILGDFIFWSFEYLNACHLIYFLFFSLREILIDLELKYVVEKLNVSLRNWDMIVRLIAGSNKKNIITDLQVQKHAASD
jgi:hypothetical protein